MTNETYPPAAARVAELEQQLAAMAKRAEEAETGREHFRQQFMLDLDAANKRLSHLSARAAELTKAVRLAWTMLWDARAAVKRGDTRSSVEQAISEWMDELEDVAGLLCAPPAALAGQKECGE